MDDQTIATYDRLAKEYDEETIDFWERFPNTILTKFTESLASGKKILDAGSGPGRDGLLLKNRGLGVVCLDASESMVQMCRERGLEAIKADLLQLPFLDQEFDGVWAYTSLLHLKKEDIGKAFDEIHRVLKTGGVLGLGMIEGEGERYRESSGVGRPRWFAFYQKQELEELLKKHGFEVVCFEEFKPGSKNYLNYLAQKL